MGLFDLPAPLFDIINTVLTSLLPPLFRLIVWGVLAGWLTMLAYRYFSNQEEIAGLKAMQRVQQKNIAEYDGEFSGLMPLIRNTLALGFRQLGKALGPALLATLPVLSIVIWVAGEFGHVFPSAGSEVAFHIEPSGSEVHWSSSAQARMEDGGWLVTWPVSGQTLTMNEGAIIEPGPPLLMLPLEHAIPVIHKKRWWNVLVANPLGYLPIDGHAEVINIDLPELELIDFGPAWVRGWKLSFFTVFLLASLWSKYVLRLH